MKENYKKSFDNTDEAFKVCPICKTDFDDSECYDTSPYKDGYRTMQICPNPGCNFKKVLSFIKEKDIEKEMYNDDDGDDEGN